MWRKRGKHHRVVGRYIAPEVGKMRGLFSGDGCRGALGKFRGCKKKRTEDREEVNSKYNSDRVRPRQVRPDNV